MGLMLLFKVRIRLISIFALASMIFFTVLTFLSATWLPVEDCADFPNQVNNVIAFPGIFKGALQARAERITEPMKLAAAEALAALVSDEELTEEFIMPDPFDSRVADAVADAVRACAASEREGA